MEEDVLYAVAGVLAVFFGGAAVLAPILAFSARFALKPVMETWIRLRQSQAADPTDTLQDRRISLLEAELQGIQQSLQTLVEAEDFRRQLANPGSAPASPPTAEPPRPGAHPPARGA